MALWGTKDTVYSTGKVNCTTAGVLTKESGSIAWTSGNGVKVGQVITIDGTSEGVIQSIDSATSLTITTRYLPSTNITNKTYEIREKPKFTLGDSNYGVNDVFGVDPTETGVAKGTAYSVAHGGWVGITSYIDSNGNTRVKTEVLVAGSSITGDDDSDDTKFADS